MTDFKQTGDLPLSGEERRRLKGRNPTEAMPAALGRHAPPAKTVKFIERLPVATRDVSAAALDGYAPPWLGASFAPRRASGPRRPIVMHRGEKLDPFFIHPPDDRTLYDDTTYPWGCVCRITRPDGGGGSGVLIGPRHVLTASHVVEWTSNTAELIEVHFAGNAARATAFTEVAWAYTQIVGEATASNIDDDYAVLTITERLGDLFGFFGVKQYNSSWDDDAVWDTIGYAADLAQFNFPTFQRSQSLDEDAFDLGSGRAIVTSADVIFGQSGSPMFGFWPNDPVPYVVAVVSAGRDGENVCAGGSNLNNIVRLARTENP